MTAPGDGAWLVLRRRMMIPLSTLVVSHLIGIVGFWWLWRDAGGTLGDALFQTFITITTIGFGEVHPLGSGGRVLTMVVAAGGIGSVFYSFTIVLDWATSEDFRAQRGRRKMQDKIDELSDHYVLAGFGRVGREASTELRDSGKSVVVIDPSDNAVVASAAGLPYIKGDATDDEVLRAAGIDRARGLIVTTASDATNLYIVMSARLIAPKLFIVSRAVDSTAVPKLERAGANRAVSPYAIGGKRMAHLILSPRVVDFFETALHRGTKPLSIGELQIAVGTRADGESLETIRRRAGGATILAVLRSPEGAVAVPADGLVLARGDHILALGTDEQLEQLETSLGV